MSGTTDNQLMMRLLDGMESVKVEIGKVGVRLDALQNIPARVQALENEMLPKDLATARFKAIEDWQMRWEARFTGAYWVVAKVVGWVVALGSACWAIGTFTYDLINK